MKLSTIGMGVAAGAAALSLGLGAGVASADPLDGVVNTTCNYGQVMAALDATNPGAAAQLHASPMAQSYLQRFLQEPLQVALGHRRGVQLRCGTRVGRVERGHHLPVVASRVHDPVQRVCGGDSGSQAQ